MTARQLYLELLEKLFHLKGWKNQTLLEISEHQQEADVVLFTIAVEGIEDNVMGSIMKEKGTSKLESFEDFLKFQPFFEEGIKLLTLMQVANNYKEFETLDKKRKKNIKRSSNPQVVEFDTFLKALMKVPKKDLVKDHNQSKKGTK